MPPSDSSDPSTDLLRRWREQEDYDALDQLLKMEVGILKHMIHGKRPGAGATSTSDIAQEAVLGFLSVGRAPSFDDPRALRGYLWRSAWRLLCKRYERDERVPKRATLDDSAADTSFLASFAELRDVDREERGAAVDVALNLLARDDRELIRRVYFAGEDIKTAGEALGLSREAANSRLVRARRLLATHLLDWSEFIG